MAGGSSALDDPSLWLAGLAWGGWLLLGNGRTRLWPSDRVRDRGTLGFAWATLLGSLGLAWLSAIAWPAAAIDGPLWVPRVAGASLAGLGIALRAWAIRALGASFTQVVAVRAGQELVTAGPYRYVRHPGYAGSLLSLAGLGLTLGNWGSLVILVAGTVVGHLPRIRVEERALEEQFGDAYRRFEHERKRLIPGVW